MRLLIGSPIRQSPAVLEAFLSSLAALNLHGLSVQYYFVDDNDHPRSAAMLREWAVGRPVTLVPGEAGGPVYEKDDVRHHWKEALVWKVARYKDAMIEYALAEGFDLLFLVDSDLVLNPFTVQQLLLSKRPIIAELFWTRWEPGQPELPQVWLQDHYTIAPVARSEQLDQAEGNRRAIEWVSQLREPGIYPVGGLGACTLLHREALAAGCRFAEIYNLSFWGEDRHFCIRAAALGYQLWVDTTLPAYHIYRDGDLAGVTDYVAATMASAAPLWVRQVAQAGLEAWGSTDWRTVTGLEGAEYLATNLRNRQESEAPSLVEKVRAIKSAARTRVEQTEVIDLDLSAGEALVRCWLTNEGTENGETFADRLQALAVLVREEGRWLIGSVEFIPETQVAAGEAEA